MDVYVVSFVSFLVLENNSGLARIDYFSNYNLSYRVRYRR